MGLNTVLVVLNDCWHDIRKSPAVWAGAVLDAMSNGPLPVTTLHNTKIITMVHSGDTSLISVGGNTGHLIDTMTGNVTDLDQIRAAARLLGYDLRKRKA